MSIIWEQKTQHIETEIINEIVEVVLDNVQDKFNERDIEIDLLKENVFELEEHIHQLEKVVKILKSDLAEQQIIDIFGETV